ncbi:MAG TPA: Holliday junction resolvase RuvX [Gemmatimonadales bacterium]
MPERRVPPEGRLLAVDWGSKHIGLAVTDPTRTIAQPLATLTRRAGRRFPMRQLRRWLDEYTPTGIIVGLPLTPEGAEGAAAQAARAAAELIAAKTGLPVLLVDERMTTALAARADGVGGRVDRDQRAAAVLLQAYLERERS